MTNNNLVVSLTILGIVAIGSFVAILLFFAGDQTFAVAALVGLVTLIGGQLLQLKASADIHTIVNSNNTALQLKVDTQAKEIRGLAVELANVHDSLVRSEDRGATKSETIAVQAAQGRDDSATIAAQQAQLTAPPTPDPLPTLISIVPRRDRGEGT